MSVKLIKGELKFKSVAEQMHQADPESFQFKRDAKILPPKTAKRLAESKEQRMARLEKINIEKTLLNKVKSQPEWKMKHKKDSKSTSKVFRGDFKSNLDQI
jgi:hypothetical protein